ncbi:MAG: pyridoxal-phosphate dependent enzyme [Candidatus Endonucleobacter sp. (ex Gigantidas childressi)]|nr:pyridoxal-phosphate dependent enzyme [Candidatus Endonucleobacter sp. (ex Gigantidas childressi)]
MTYKMQSISPEILTAPEELNAIYTQIKPYVRLTPLMESSHLSELISGKVLVKPESLQVTGAFKFRGALYRLMQLDKYQKKQGVMAYSSGNFAVGLAHAGRILDISVHLVMPFDAPINKIENVRRQGASITLCHDFQPSREEAASEMAAALARRHEYVLLHPFDDPLLINGQATVGVELRQQLLEGGLTCDSLLCPSGGGSLVAGCSFTFSPVTNGSEIYAIESLGYDGMSLSLRERVVTRAAGGASSDCDALLALTPGQAAFNIARLTAVKGLSVSESYVKQALRLAFEELHLVLEPSGAIALAAVLAFPEKFHRQTLVIIASGGNVDLNKYRSLVF